MPHDGITLRPQTDADRGFLAGLYAGTREEELKQTDWTDEVKRLFCRSQFDAQCEHYAQYYPNASFDVIERDGVPVGRLYVYRSDPKDVRIVDISLVAEARGTGLGTELLLEIMRGSEEARTALSSHVQPLNPPPSLPT